MDKETQHTASEGAVSIPGLSTAALATQTATMAPGPTPLQGGFNLKALPPDTLLDDAQTALALGVKASTLAVWRSCGRYNIPYLKIGRKVRYKAADLAAWLESRARLHTGEK